VTGNPIFVWDTSAYDYGRGPVDLAAAAADGIAAVTAKATEGRSFADSRFATTAGRARGTVRLFGAYHVLHPASISPISDQVNWHLLTLNVRSPWWSSGPWLVQLDCERWATNDFPTAADIQAWCDLFRARTAGRYTPIVYASRGQYGDSLAGIDCPLWNADYGANQAGPYRAAYPGDGWRGWTPYSGRTPAMVQYGSALTVGGQHTCDVSAFRGSLDQLITLTSGGGGRAMEWSDPNIVKLLGPTYKTPDPILVDLLAYLQQHPSFYDPSQRPAASATLARIDATVSGLATQLAALTAAFTTLTASGTSGDTAAVLQAVKAVGDEDSAAVAALQQQLADVTRRLAQALSG
jgi:GH25 family lysozyme M1 (1,4-beta-N-acetylmuramidase)